MTFDPTIWSVLNPKKTGGPKTLKGLPPTFRAITLQRVKLSHRNTLWLFSFKFPSHFETEFEMPGGTFLKLLYTPYILRV